MFRKSLIFLKKEFLYLYRYPMQGFLEIFLPILAILPNLLLTYYFIEKKGIASFKETTGTNNYFLFIGIGIVFSIFISIQEQTGYLLSKEMWMGTLEQMWLTPTKKFNFFLGWILFSLIKGVLYALISIGTLKLLFYKLSINLSIYNYKVFIISLLFLLIISVCSGIVICSITLVVKQVDPIVFLITGLVPLLSGMTYPIWVLPKSLQYISKILPTTYIFDMVRYSVLGSKTIFEPQIELLIILVFVVIFILFTIIFFYYLKRKVDKSGTIFLM